MKKRKYRIIAETILNSRGTEPIDIYLVQVKCWFGWATVKEFVDDDADFACRCAMELLDNLNE